MYTLLAEGTRHPDERFWGEVRGGRFTDELRHLSDILEVELPEAPDSKDIPETQAAFDNEYISLFEGLESPYAPPVESVYRPWRDGTSKEGLLSGPSASDMRDRYRAAGLSAPEPYPADHLTLLLEYAAFLLRSGESAEYVSFVEDHLDWLPAFRRLASEAVAESPFHSYCVVAVCETVAEARLREGISEPEPRKVDEMYKRAMELVE